MRVVAALAAFPMSEQRCVTAVAKWVLVNAPHWHRGRQVDPIAKSLGAGVYVMRNKGVESD